MGERQPERWGQNSPLPVWAQRWMPWPTSRPGRQLLTALAVLAVGLAAILAAVGYLHHRQVRQEVADLPAMTAETFFARRVERFHYKRIGEAVVVAFDADGNDAQPELFRLQPADGDTDALLAELHRRGGQGR